MVDGIEVRYADGTAAPLRGGNGIPQATTQITDLSFTGDDPLTAISGEWGTWFGGSYITKIRFHTRSGTVSPTYGTGQSVTNAKPFTLQAPSPATQEVIAFFGSQAPANNDSAWCLGSIGVVVR